ncbi:MAG: STAS-like domain-containing protein [Clostridia bacterium]|nr:STAS-like domain-containing protein [Clostridia bacterium]
MSEHNQIVNISIKDNEIIIENLNHPKCVSDFIRGIQSCIRRGWTDIILRCNAEVIFPNACVPIAGIIQYYKQQNIQFTFEFDKESYLNKCSFKDPFVYSDEDDLESVYALPLDKIYCFNSGLQVAKLSQSFVNILSTLCECEKGVLDSINWCITEVMDNVLTHSGRQEGYVMAQYHPKTNHIAFCVYDYGMGIFNSLKDSKHYPRYEIDALTLAIQEGVGDGKGQGNGLYGLYEAIQKNKGILSITSGGSSIMLTSAGELKKYEKVPKLSDISKQTIVDFQINLDKEIDFKSIFASISSSYEAFDIRIDEMLSEEDEFIHYDVYANSQGTGTREAGSRLRNDVINTLRRENRIIILDFKQVHTVSSSFIDEFIGKLVIKMGFIKFNRIVKIENMNESVAFLCERSLYMRISEEWENRKIQNDKEIE